MQVILKLKIFILTLDESLKCLIALATLGVGNPIEAICFTVVESLGLKLAVGSGSVYWSGLATAAVAAVVVAVVVLVCGLGGSLGGCCEDMAASYDGNTEAVVVTTAGTLEYEGN